MNVKKWQTISVITKPTTKEDYFTLIKPYISKLLTVCKDDVNEIVAKRLDGRKVTEATDDELSKLDSIYNELVTKATLLGIEV